MSYKDELRTMVPEHTIGGIDTYVEQHILPGGFLTAVLSNDLSEAFGRADETNQAAMFDIVNYLHNCTPAVCWGSPKAVSDWVKVEPVEKEQGDEQT